MKKFTKLAFIACFCLFSARVSAQWSLTGNNNINAATNFVGTLNSADLVFRTNNVERMRINTLGNVGIGTSPSRNLHIRSSNAGIRLEKPSGFKSYWDIHVEEGPSGKLHISNFAVILDQKLNTVSITDTILTFLSSGNVGIGTANPQSTLAVNGKITAKEVEVTLNGWADFVFKPGYKLLPLTEVDKFIKEHRHLPGVPSEAEVLAKNQNLGEMNALLMQKIEELTLYVIEGNKRTEKLERENTILRSLFDKIIK